MQLIECEQRTQAWWSARRGVPTASQFGKILTPKTMKASSSQESYICKLLAEKYANVWPQENIYVSQSMQNGIDGEDAARAWYAFDQDVDVQQVGFVLSDCGRFGCSPDGLIGDDGGLEIKVPDLETHAGYLLNGTLPDEYKCQVHGSLIVTGRKWWDFVSYSDCLPALRVRVVPTAFTTALADELAKFRVKYDAAIDQIESLRH